jgi:hypothetical protein
MWPKLRLLPVAAERTEEEEEDLAEEELAVEELVVEELAETVAAARPAVAEAVAAAGPVVAVRAVRAREARVPVKWEAVAKVVDVVAGSKEMNLLRTSWRERRELCAAMWRAHAQRQQCVPTPSQFTPGSWRCARQGASARDEFQMQVFEVL